MEGTRRLTRIVTRRQLIFACFGGRDLVDDEQHVVVKVDKLHIRMIRPDFLKPLKTRLAEKIK